MKMLKMYTHSLYQSLFLQEFPFGKFHKPESKLYQNQYTFTGSGIIFTDSSIILKLVYEIFPIGLLWYLSKYFLLTLI